MNSVLLETENRTINVDGGGRATLQVPLGMPLLPSTGPLPAVTQCKKNRRTSPLNRCYGIDIAEDGTLVVAERTNCVPATTIRYPAGAAGASALLERVGHDLARPRVCIRSCGAAAMAIAISLSALPVGEVTLVTPRAIEGATRSGRETAPPSPEDRAQRLARLAERLY